MLTAFLALMVAFFTPSRLTGWFAVVRPYLFYFLAVVVVFLGAVWGIHYVGQRAVDQEHARIQQQVEIKLREDNLRVEADKKALEEQLSAIQSENTALKERIRRLPTAKQIIQHPKAAAKAFNSDMNDQFKRFEEITK